jgi:hypothetical protein
MEERLKTIMAEAYMAKLNVAEIINRLTDEELKDIFSNALEGLMQEGRI